MVTKLISTDYFENTEHEYIEQLASTSQNWATSDYRTFFFAMKAVKKIPSNLYSVQISNEYGYGLGTLDYNIEEFINLPSLPHKNIIDDLNNFWDNIGKFVNYKLTPKRGIILYGNPGCGKTSLIYLLVEEMKKKNGISIHIDNPNNWVGIAKIIRKIEKDRPILCIIEDIDLIIAEFGEENFLSFLDGLNGINNVVYVATTNNLEKIPDRIKNRPSRFDRVYEISKPNDEDRKLYFDSILTKEDKKKYDLTKLINDTKGFTMAHLKETFISLYILCNPYDDVIKILKKSNITDGKPMGFNLNG